MPARVDCACGAIWLHVWYMISRGIWDIAVDLTGYGIRDMGYSLGLATAGTRDTGYGIRDMGYSAVPPPLAHGAGYGIWLRDMRKKLIDAREHMG